MPWFKTAALARPGMMLAAAFLLAACAAQVPVRPAQLLPLNAPAPEIVVQQQAALRLSTHYERILPAGGRWQAVGALPQGVVYRPVDTVFTIEGKQVHEAYLVVQGGALQGFYLPGEGNFSPLVPSVPLSIGAKP